MLNQTAAPLGELVNILSTANAAIVRSEIRIPGFRRPQPFRIDLKTLRHNQEILERDLARRAAEQTGGQLGFAPLVVGAVVGAGILVTGIGGWIYKHYSDTKRVEMRTEIYQQMLADGLSPEEAADSVYGAGSEVGAVMNKAIILSLIGVGALILFKWK